MAQQGLSDDAVKVLLVLWKERYVINYLDEGLTPEEIRQKADFVGISSVYNAIKELNERDERWSTLVEVRPRSLSKGRKPQCYMLDGDNVSDWPRSSFFLMELAAYDKKRPRQIDAPSFCEHLLTCCGYRDQDDLDTIVVGLCKLDYLYRSPELPTLAQPTRRGYILLSLNKRAKFEKQFIHEVALKYPKEAEEDGRSVSGSLFLGAIGYYKNRQSSS